MSAIHSPEFPQSGSARGSTLRILCVEDDPDSAALVRAIVNLVGTRLHVAPDFVVAKDGETALREAHAQPPDLVMLDLGLPDIPGEEVLARLREDAATAATPVIVLTAKTYSAETMPDDYDAYVTKPIHDVRAFIGTVERALA
jgi:DNA-binding response OmpR family regulator